MTGATLFSGILAPELAAPDITWKWCAEIDREASGVIAYRKPGHVNLGDVTAPDFIERAKSYGAIDLLVFGSPCQSFSVAGRRLGMDDPRGNLALIALGIVAALRPRWFVFENVPGLFSSWSDSEREGIEESDFASWLCAVQECRYHVCWKILDAQWSGVPQRRRRIFAVGHSGDWQHSAAVLSFPEGVRRNHKKSSKEGTGSARPVNASSRLRRLWESLVRSFGEGEESPPPRRPEEIRHGSVAVNCRDYKLEGDKTGTLQVPGEGGWSLSSQNAVLEPQAIDNALTANGVGICGADDNQGQAGHLLPVVSHCEPVSRALTACKTATGRLDPNEQEFIAYEKPVVSHDTSPAVLHRGHKGQDTYMTLPMVAHTLSAEGFDASCDGTGRGTPLIPEIFPTLLSSGAGVERAGNTNAEHEQYIPELKDSGFLPEISPTVCKDSYKPQKCKKNTEDEWCIPALADSGFLPEVADPLIVNERTYTHEGKNNFRLRNCVPAAPPIGFYGNLGSQGGGIEHDQTPPLKAGSHENLTAVAFQNTGHGWWNESEIGATVRTPDGGGSMEANVVAFPERKPAIAFQERTRGEEGQYLDYTEDVSYTLTSPKGGGRRQEMNVCVPEPVAFSLRGREDGRQAEVDPEGLASNLRAANGGSSRSFVASPIALDPYSPTSDGNTTQTVRASEGGGSHDNLVGIPVISPTMRAAKNATGGDRPPGTDVDTCESLIPVAQPVERLILQPQWAVRRLIPVETERLQGIPDNWTLIPWRNGMMADGPRYRMIGNSMAVPCMKWILDRLKKVDQL